MTLEELIDQEFAFLVGDRELPTQELEFLLEEAERNVWIREISRTEVK